MATGKEAQQPMETEKSSRASSVLTTASGTSVANSEVSCIVIAYIACIRAGHTCACNYGAVYTLFTGIILYHIFFTVFWVMAGPRKIYPTKFFCQGDRDMRICTLDHESLFLSRIQPIRKIFNPRKL